MPIEVLCPSCSHRFRADERYSGTRVACPACESPVLLEGAAVPAFDVFISHSAVDKIHADAVCAGLEAAGLRCWIAPRDITGGAKWADAIVKGISESRLMVLVLSERATTSEQVMNEVEQAVRKGIPILPFRIEDVSPSSEMAYFISRSHWLDAFPPPLSKYIGALVRDVSLLLSDEGQAKRMTLIKAQRLHPLSRRWALAGLSAAAVVALALGMAEVFSTDGSPDLDLIAAKALADQLWRTVQQVDDRDGFGEEIDRYERTMGELTSQFAARDFTGLDRFEQTVDGMRDLLRRAEMRDQARAGHAAAIEQQEHCCSLPLGETARQESRRADQDLEEGSRLLAAGRFESARERFSHAEKAYGALIGQHATRQELSAAIERYETLQRFAQNQEYEVPDDAELPFENPDGSWGKNGLEASAAIAAYVEAYRQVNEALNPLLRSRAFDLGVNIASLIGAYVVQGRNLRVDYHDVSGMLDFQCMKMESHIQQRLTELALDVDLRVLRGDLRSFTWDVGMQYCEDTLKPALRAAWGADVIDCFATGVNLSILWLGTNENSKRQDVMKFRDVQQKRKWVTQVLKAAEKARLPEAIVKPMRSAATMLDAPECDDDALNGCLNEAILAAQALQNTGF